MSGDQITAILLILAGGFSFVGAVANWEWFFNHPRSRFFVKFLGRNGARIFYMVLGSILAGIGVASMLGMLPGTA